MDYVPPPATRARFPPIAIDPALGEYGKQLVAAVQGTLDSARFRSVFASADSLHINGNGHGIDGSEALAALLQDEAPIKLVPAPADIPYEGTKVELSAGTATIALSPSVLVNWRTGGPRERACAVDALAHAIAHAVVDQGGKPRFGDNVSTFVRTPGTRVVTFAAGAIAACAFLEVNGDRAFEPCLDRMYARESDCVRPPPG